MKQPIANIVLKLDKIGATVALKHVTPAEVMLLCAMHSGNAGEMPIVKFDLIDPKSNEMALKSLQDELSKQEALLEELSGIENITEEVRERRAITIQGKIESYQSRINGLQYIINIRNLSPSAERARLTGKYNQIVVNKFYPGNMPTIPTDFPNFKPTTPEEHASLGEWSNLKLHAGQHDHFLVGAAALQG